ncbi:MAG: hypothetical protein V4757_06725 [Pseudomonadota bacterium]
MRHTTVCVALLTVVLAACSKEQAVPARPPGVMTVPAGTFICESAAAALNAALIERANRNIHNIPSCSRVGINVDVNVLRTAMQTGGFEIMLVGNAGGTGYVNSADLQ